MPRGFFSVTKDYSSGERSLQEVLYLICRNSSPTPSPLALRSGLEVSGIHHCRTFYEGLITQRLGWNHKVTEWLPFPPLTATPIGLRIAIDCSGKSCYSQMLYEEELGKPEVKRGNKTKNMAKSSGSHL